MHQLLVLKNVSYHCKHRNLLFAGEILCVSPFTLPRATSREYCALLLPCPSPLCTIDLTPVRTIPPSPGTSILLIPFYAPGLISQAASLGARSTCRRALTKTGLFPTSTVGTGHALLCVLAYHAIVLSAPTTIHCYRCRLFECLNNTRDRPDAGQTTWSMTPSIPRRRHALIRTMYCRLEHLSS